jgi:thioesterase domain-containing protein
MGSRVFSEPDVSHLVPFRSSGTRLPLFCFPGSGGEASIFGDMAALMRKDQPVYAVDIGKFRESHERFTIEQLAAFYRQVILSIQKHGPYYLCGYSFGGLVAYEIATLLANDGEDVGLLALLDAPNPALTSNLSGTESAQFRAVYLADRLKKYGRNLLRGDITKLMTDAVAFLGPRAGASVWSAIRVFFRTVGRPIPELLRSNDRAFLAAWQAYIPKPYPKRLVIFRGQDRGPEYDLDSTMGWGTCAVAGLDVHVQPGGHVNMMSQPNVRSLADKLTAYLDNSPGEET